MNKDQNSESNKKERRSDNEIESQWKDKIEREKSLYEKRIHNLEKNIQE